MYVYRPGGTHNNIGTVSQALYNDAYTYRDFTRNTITDNSTFLTTSFIEGDRPGGLNISDIQIYEGGDSASFYIGAAAMRPLIFVHPNSVFITEGKTLSLSIKALNSETYQ